MSLSRMPSSPLSATNPPSLTSGGRDGGYIIDQNYPGRLNFRLRSKAAVALRAYPGNVTTRGPLRVATTVCSYCTVGALGLLKSVHASPLSPPSSAHSAPSERNGFHGEDEAFIHDPPLGLNRPSCDLRRLLVQRMPDAVAGKILNECIAVSASEGADRLSDVAERLVRADLPGAGPHGSPPITAKPLDRFGDRRYGERCARIGKNTVLLRGNVDIDQVTRSNPAVPRNAVSDLFVDTDAGRTGETVAKLGSRRGPCSFQKTDRTYPARP